MLAGQSQQGLIGRGRMTVREGREVSVGTVIGHGGGYQSLSQCKTCVGAVGCVSNG